MCCTFKLLNKYVSINDIGLDLLVKLCAKINAAQKLEQLNREEIMYKEQKFLYQKRKKENEDRLFNKYMIENFEFNMNWISGCCNELKNDKDKIKLTRKYKQYLKHTYFIDHPLNGVTKSKLDKLLQVNNKTYDDNIEDLCKLIGYAS